MKTKKSKKKAVVPVKQPKWIPLETISGIKWDSFTLGELEERALKLAPKGTTVDDIRISFEMDEEPTYYDEIIIDLDLIIEYLEK